jgi:hypothetical protein
LTGSARKARSTGHARSSTLRACALKRGIADRPKPGRSRQAGLEDPHPDRPERPAPRPSGLSGEPSRLPGLRAAHPRHPQSPVPPRSPAAQARESPRGQGLRHPRQPPAPARAAHRRPHRPHRHRILGPARPLPVGRRTHHRLARRLPPPDLAIRAPRPSIRRIPRPRSRHHLLQETRQLRHALRSVISSAFAPGAFRFPDNLGDSAPLADDRLDVIAP